MKVKYFSDTDTAHVEFTGNNVFETKEISDWGSIGGLLLTLDKILNESRADPQTLHDA